MTDFNVSLTIGSSNGVTWDYTGIPSGDVNRHDISISFDQGKHGGGPTVYTQLRISIHSGLWRDCTPPGGPTPTHGSTDRTPSIPAEGESLYESFCIQSFLKSRGWKDPKIKIINKDGTGNVAAPLNSPTCDCS